MTKRLKTCKMLKKNFIKHPTLIIFSYLDFPFYTGLSRRIEGLINQLSFYDIRSIIISPISRLHSPIPLSLPNTHVIRVDLRKIFLQLIQIKIVKLIVLMFFSLHALILLIKLKSRYDLPNILQYESIYSFIPAFLSKVFLNMKIIGDDLIFLKRTPLPQKILYALILKNTDYIVVSNLPSYKKLTAEFPYKQILFTPNGVFKEKIDFSKKRLNQLIFVGILTYKENIEAVKSIVELVQMMGHRIKYDILLIGGPQQALRKMKKQANKKIKFLGYLEEKRYKRILRSAFIGLLPFFRENEWGGQRIKTLEFLSHGLLTISTLQGVRGIRGLKPDKHYLQFSNLEELNNLLQTISDNPKAYMNIAREGQRFVAEKYHWRRVTESYIRLIISLLDNESPHKSPRLN